MSEMQNVAALCRRIPLSVNSSTQRPVIPDDPETELRSSELPELVVGETVVFCLSFLDQEGSPLVFSGNEVFELSGDCDYDRENGLMFYAGPDQLNLPGDWADADPAQGKIALRVNCNTENFVAKLGGKKQLPVSMEVRMTAADAVTRSILLRSTATAVNSIHLNETLPEAIKPEYYTTGQVEARLNTKADLEHTHACSQIPDFESAVAEQIAPVEQNLNARINEKAEADHTHEQYAESAHIHEQYIEAEFVENRVTAAMPAGTVIAYAGSSAPYGFIACNGAAVSRETYASLFAAIGTLYGEGDGSTTFNLPDLTDRVVQGSSTAGTVLAAGLPNISGTMTERAFVRESSGGNITLISQSGGAFRTSTTSYEANTVVCELSSTRVTDPAVVSFDASKSNAIYGNSNTVQPPALTMIYCIKY